MSRICLDTSAYSQFRRGHRPVVDRIDSAREVFIPAIVLGELRAGFRLGKLSTGNEGQLQSFLGHPVVSVVEVDDETASHYADLWVDLRRARTPVPTNDVWVAAAALRCGSMVLTYDDHFQKMSRVGCSVLSL